MIVIMVDLIVMSNVTYHHGNQCRETGKIVDNLEGLAEEIGEELDRQNELIPKITDKVTKVTVDVKATTDHLQSNLN